MPLSLPVTSLTAVLCGALLLWLTLIVVRLRRKDGVVLGDNGDRVLAKAIRGHGNAAEQMPMALILLGLSEAQGAPFVLLLPGALIFLAGRALHALYFARHGTHWKARFWGMWLTVIGQAVLIATLLLTTFA